jgi:hypothetical protein
MTEREISSLGESGQTVYKTDFFWNLKLDFIKLTYPSGAISVRIHVIQGVPA